jgi:hypothetical protein
MLAHNPSVEEMGIKAIKAEPELAVHGCRTPAATTSARASHVKK